ncbi:hypothetical protein DL766_007788 [Monosporascus sp. MC13-8B]|uniref:beta-glucosidase n=1 Tax=Monosporascus cannonballus TaxID=155416 RepID=A0ABY0H1H8_9PEZI|nr:hypothetical protein DL763_008956 [Monosporascus cannonballus]RYO82433.1 hypothetical protein DL762_006635 [Monosporascus cannonballus]RYP22064.1 hypothetical protein DL766_007788 [Monosporascus sp. MC13-8B]
MIVHVLTALLAAAPLASSAPSVKDAHDLGGKARQIFHTPLLMLPRRGLDRGNPDAPRLDSCVMIEDRFISHYNLVGGNDDAYLTAPFINRAQELAFQIGLGIPITTPTGPHHSFTENIGTGSEARMFLKWPQVLRLVATLGPALVRKFAEVVREECRAAGFPCAPHPTLDLATEPRWGISTATNSALHDYGNQALSRWWSRGKRGRLSVSYGINATYPGNNVDYNLIPFKAAIAAGARAMILYYSPPIDTKYEEVRFSFNKGIVPDLLLKELGFEESMPNILNVGVDQFGGEHVTEMLLDLVRNGSVSEERIDTSARRLMHEKPLPDLYDRSFVDPDAAERIIGNGHFVQLGAEAQRRSCTLLTNHDTVPLRRARRGSKFDVEGFDKGYIEARNATVVDTPKEADFALLEMEAPSFPRSGASEKSFASGSLELDEGEKARQAKTYDSSADAFLDVDFGLAKPEGRLPFGPAAFHGRPSRRSTGMCPSIPRNPSSGPETV